ncbi:CDGSH iron-sulfur domain-containing protein [Candidatus Woesearchaeota archaeon]|nr:CDGSH iron-sulfur domain-containing protein [Candidatus Woesearchaeota archaeon]
MEEKQELPDTAVEVEVKAGGKYSFCTCGQSKRLPYCDSSHKGYNEKTGAHYKSLKVFPEQDSKIKVSSSNWKEE